MWKIRIIISCLIAAAGFLIQRVGLLSCWLFVVCFDVHDSNMLKAVTCEWPLTAAANMRNSLQNTPAIVVELANLMLCIIVWADILFSHPVTVTQPTVQVAKEEQFNGSEFATVHEMWYSFTPPTPRTANFSSDVCESVLVLFWRETVPFICLTCLSENGEGKKHYPAPSSLTNQAFYPTHSISRNRRTQTCSPEDCSRLLRNAFNSYVSYRFFYIITLPCAPIENLASLL